MKNTDCRSASIWRSLTASRAKTNLTKKIYFKSIPAKEMQFYCPFAFETKDYITK